MTDANDDTPKEIAKEAGDDSTTAPENKKEETQTIDGEDGDKKDSEADITTVSAIENENDKKDSEEGGGAAKEETTDTAKETSDEVTENGTKTDEPPAKKKRNADRQITKDDEEEDEEDDESGIDRNAPFKRASAEVLAQRKILRAKRPDPTKNPGSSNPFASTSLSTSANGNGNGNGSSKVFGSGSGFSGFGAAAAAAGSSTGFGSSSGFSGFGTAAASSSSGFGTATASSSSGFGTAAATDSKDSNDEKQKTTGFGSSSLFGTSGSGGSSGFTFGFGKTSSDSTNGNGSNSGASPRSSSGAAIAKLPDRVELTTGEEDEENLHEVRCKSFKWAKEELKTSGSAVDSENHAIPGSSAAPSVKPSTNFENKAETKDGEQAENDDDAKKDNYRWRELGVGPLKVLLNADTGKYRLVQRQESTPNGNAHKVILNLPLWKETACQKTSDKHLTITTIAASGDNERYALKFKEAYQAFSMWNELQHRIPMAKSCFKQGDKTTAE